MKNADALKQRVNMSFTSQMMEELKNAGRLVKYKKGEHIFRDKYNADNIFILVHGKASISKMSDDGQKKTILILDDGSLLNEPSSEIVSLSANCAAFEDCSVLVIDQSTFYDKMSKDFELTKIVINQLSHKTRRMYRQLKNAAASTRIEKKVAAKLWKLCLDYGKECEGRTLIDIEITSSNLADLMGVRRETVSRALKILKDKGLIVFEKRRLYILSVENLSAFFKSS